MANGVIVEAGSSVLGFAMLYFLLLCMPECDNHKKKQQEI